MGENPAEVYFLTEDDPQELKDMNAVLSSINHELDYLRSAIVKEQVNVPEFVEIYDDEDVIVPNDQVDPLDITEKDKKVLMSKVKMEIFDDDKIPQEASLRFTYIKAESFEQLQSLANTSSRCNVNANKNDKLQPAKKSLLNYSPPWPYFQDMSYKKCAECQKSFSSQSILDMHSIISHKRQAYPCKECQKQFTSPSDLQDHSVIHTEETPTYTCPQCSSSFFMYNEIIDHLKTHQKKKKRCQICEKWFLKDKSLATHMKIHEGQNIVKNPQKRKKIYKCGICKASFSEKENLIMHTQNHGENMKNYKCSKCRNSFFSNGELIEHLRSHTRNKEYKCSVCDKAFPSAYEFEVHLNNDFEVTEKRSKSVSKKKKKSVRVKEVYKCTNCESIHLEEMDMIKHLLTHGEDKTGRLTYLKKSLLTEHRDVSFNCSLCKESFPERKDLIKHTKVHTEKQVYKCPECPKMFTRSFDLKLHSSVHTGRKLKNVNK